MIARHFRPRAGDCFVNALGQTVRVQWAKGDLLMTYGGTWTKHAHRKMLTISLRRQVWFYPCEGGASVL